MSFVKTTFVNGQAPALSAEELNKMGQGVEDAFNAAKNVELKSQFGTMSMNENVSASSIRSKSIPLTFNAVRGMAIVRTNYFGSGLIFFTRSMNSSKGFLQEYAYPYLYSSDGYLISFDGAYNTKVYRAYISGSNLIIDFKNDDTLSRPLSGNVFWEVFG